VAGALLALSVLAVLSIGVFVLPFAALAVWAALRWGRGREAVGLLVGAVLLMLALVAIGTWSI
jgi:hypothetical protein